jgi:hypothetical protein
MAKKPVAKPKRGVGRPSKFDQKTFDVICEKVSTGMTLNEVCRMKGMPLAVTVRAWVMHNKPPGIYTQYARAKELQLEAMADEMQEIADHARNDWMTRNFRGVTSVVPNREVIDRSKLRVETRKWLLSKLARGRFGEPREGKPEGDEGAVIIKGGLPES